MAYTFGTTIEGSLEEAEVAVGLALAEEGFGVLTRIDVKATMKAKLDIDVDPYVILGACNPNFAHQAISADPEIGALLPCNVVLRTEGDQVAVRFMDPSAVLGIVNSPDVDVVGATVKEMLERVSASLG